MLLRHMSFAVQTSDQKSHWHHNESRECAMRAAEDSRTHRLLECPAGNDVREAFVDTIRAYWDHGSHLAELMAINVHPLLQAVRTMHFAQPTPILPEHVIHMVHQRASQGIETHWFTDGSCSFPKEPTCRFSAFAIALDLCHTDAQRLQYLRARDSASPDTCFTCVLQARAQGEQDILRAELYAAMVIMTQASLCNIHMDSQSAIDMLTVALEVDNPAIVLAMEHCDILLQVWEQRRSIRATLTKVKAHATERDLSLRAFWEWGNEFVDGCAKRACDELYPQFHQDLVRVQQDIQADQLLLKELFKLHLQLRPAGEAAAAVTVERGDFLQPTADAILLAYQNWLPPNAVTTIQCVNTTFLEHCAWGEDLALKIVEWLQRLQWPGDLGPSGPLQLDTGISWPELAFAFMYETEQYLPAIRDTSDNIQRVVFPGTCDTVRELGITAGEFAFTFRTVIDNVCALLPECIFPDIHRRKIPSLYLLGLGRYTQGLSCRPACPMQDRAVRLFQSQFAAGNSHLDWMIDLGFPDVPELLLPTEWLQRKRKAKAVMHHVRRVRTQ